MTSHIDQAVQQRIATAKQKRAKRRQQRAELAEARGYGLESRHLTKMRRWAADDDTAMGQSPTTDGGDAA